MGEKKEETKELIIRRIECKSPDGKDYVQKLLRRHSRN